ncbi:DedA family protein [Protaetiibacter larvae]|uniref:DedA family protein n=1 Tax=Protaetiibacter larvae TaxID=2592654 RepID=A0A5C1Y7U3_9MICO|nr:DedA family protein [Protaetiibacter larvae]QEO09786.1 DedA family protein [Protaetiibacter larvae]
MNWLNELLTAVLDAVQSVDPVLRTLIAGLGIFLETSLLVGLVVPGDTIVIVAATAVRSPVEYLALVVVVVLGALGGESVGFALGRFFGPRIRASRLGRRIGEHNWHRAENYVDRRGGIAVFVSRFLPVLHSLVPVTVGMSTMRYRKFIAWTLPASVIWAFAYVTVGSLAAGSYRQLSQQLHGAGYLFVAVIVVFLAAVVVTKKLIERSQARHWAHPGDGDANTIDPIDPIDDAA